MLAAVFMVTVGISAKDKFVIKHPLIDAGTCVESIDSLTQSICPDGFGGDDCRLTSGSELNSTIDATKIYAIRYLEYHALKQELGVLL